MKTRPRKPRLKGKKRATLPATFTPRLFEHADGRMSVVKELKRRVEELMEDTGADSLQKRILCKRVVFIAVQLETMEITAAEGEVINAAVYGQLTNTMLGCLRALGLEKQMSKEITDLETYLNGKRTKQ